MMPKVRFSGFGQARNLVLVRFCTKKGLKKMTIFKDYFMCQLCQFHMFYPPKSYYGLRMFEPYPNHHSQG